MIGHEIHKFAKELWPLNRSITGDGVRATLNRIKFHLPKLQINSIPSGTAVFDWVIPKSGVLMKPILFLQVEKNFVILMLIIFIFWAIAYLLRERLN